MDTQNRPARKKHHVIYKTTCLITSKYYIGMHSTDNLADGYMGSGKYLRNSIKKHGLENHRCEVLEYLPDRASLKIREAELVDHVLLEDKLCMNLTLGGEGGWEIVNSSEYIQDIRRANGKKSKGDIHLGSRPWSMPSSELLLRRRRKVKELGINYNAGHIGMKRSNETKQRISIAKTGKNNNQFGTMWITNGTENKNIKKDILIPDGWYKGRKMSQFIDL